MPDTFKPIGFAAAKVLDRIHPAARSTAPTHRDEVDLALYALRMSILDLIELRQRTETAPLLFAEEKHLRDSQSVLQALLDDIWNVQVAAE